MNYIKIILIILNFIIFIPMIHFVIFGIIYFFKRDNDEFQSNKNNRFLILIAARNEEEVIANLIHSLKTQNYPKELYRICVLPNNSTDRTKEISLSENCMVIEPDIMIKSKGDVLNYAFDYFKEDNSFDAYLIFDADNLVEPNFLMEINKKLTDEYPVIQGFRDTKNLYDTSISGSYALFYYLQSKFIYEARGKIGGSANVSGTGYAILKKVVDKLNFRPKTLTEDIELGTVCAINHINIGYSKNAVFYDEQVSKLIPSFTQRIRWIQGTLQVFKKYVKDVLKEIKNNKNLQLIDMLYVISFPVHQLISIILMFISTIVFFNPIIMITMLALGYLGFILISLYLTLSYNKNYKLLLKGILFFAIFNITWIPIYIYSIFNKNTNWKEIKHTKNISIENILRK